MKLKLVEKRDEKGDAKTFIWEPSEPLSWQPGQFLEYTFPHKDPDDRGIVRWFTLSSAPSEKKVALTTRLVEKRSSFKKALNELAIGSEISAEGPKGKFVIEDFEPYYVLVAGGIGVTPYRSIIKEFDHNQNSLNGVLVYLSRDQIFLFQDIFDGYAEKNEGFRTLYQQEGLTPEIILEEIPVGTKPIFYLSGPEGMVEYYEKMLIDMGFANEQIKKDEFPGYEWNEDR